MCFDRNINENKDVKILEVRLVSCAMVRENHFKQVDKQEILQECEKNSDQKSS